MQAFTQHNKLLSRLKKPFKKPFKKPVSFPALLTHLCSSFEKSFSSSLPTSCHIARERNGEQMRSHHQSLSTTLLPLPLLFCITVTVPARSLAPIHQHNQRYKSHLSLQLLRPRSCCHRQQHPGV